MLGTHRGHTHYTIGQRKGLELAMGRRVYVTGKDVERNWVYIGDNEDLFSRALEAVDLNLIACDAIPSPLRCTAKSAIAGARRRPWRSRPERTPCG